MERSLCFLVLGPGFAQHHHIVDWSQSEQKLKDEAYSLYYGTDFFTS